MKIPSAMATGIAAVMLVCALSTGGQPQSKKKPSAPPPGYHEVPAPQQGTAKGKATAKPPGWIPVPQQWRMPDGRVVEFPASTSEEEIDALAKRIAEGAVELPPGARVVGWEPVEGADSLLPGYEQRVATIPTTKGKLDALANAAGILQAQANVLRKVEQLHSDYAGNQLLHYAKILDDHAALINEALAVAADADNRLRNLDTQDLKRELDKFKAAACPVLRRAARGPERSWDDVAGALKDQAVRRELDSACGLH